MAKPDLDDGFIQLAHELFAAVMVAQIPKEARIVLFEVFSQIYGLSRAKTAKLSPTEIAGRTGLAKQNINRGIAFLLKNGVLKRAGLDAYIFVKNYDSWGSDGEPLLTPKLAAYSFFAPRLACSKVPQRPEDFGPAKPENRVIETDYRSTDAVDNGSSMGNQETAVLSSKWITPPPISKEKEVVAVAEGPDTTSTPSSKTESDDAPLPTNGKPALWSMVPFQHDPAEVDRMADLCGELVGQLEDTIPSNVRRMSRSYPLWYFRYAITRGLAKAGPGRVWAYAIGVMNNLWAQGIADEPREAPTETQQLARPAPASTPAPPPVRMSAAAARSARIRAACDAEKAAHRAHEEKP